nr:DNA alkylation repair protein [Auraticoccus cholistanensis]
MESLADPEELPRVRRRLAPDEPAIGMRMRDLFTVAAEARSMPLEEVERLLDEPAYEPRMAACCVLDFKAREALGDRALSELYLRRHDRITTWDMVDRAAPRVVGAPLVGGDVGLLHELARSPQPLRRRTAATAPLYFVRSGSESDLAGGFAVVAALAADPEPVVHQAVGIFLKHAGERVPLLLSSFLDRHAATMPRAAVRLAVEKVDPSVRRRYVG